MLNWHRLIYIGDKVKDDYENIRAALDGGSYVSGVYMICLSENPIEQLDVINSFFYAANGKRYSGATVVGLARGYEEAQGLVANMARDVFSKTEAVGIRRYFEETL